MKLGACTLVTDRTLTPVELARELEDHGFESFWVGEHSHLPVDRNQDGPVLDPRTGKPILSMDYARLLDPFLTLTYAAAVTTRLRIGTSVCMVTMRDPIHTAKQVATLDHLSQGRFMFGVGAGWNERALRNHRTDPRQRYALLGERVRAMKEIWTQEVASYDGELVHITPLMAFPKPVQQPHPPIYIGGNFKNIPRVVAYGDGWIPSTGTVPAEVFLGKMGELQRLAADAGRGPIPVTGVHVTPLEHLDVGNLEFSDEQWDQWERAGVERAVLILPPNRDACLRLIERYSRFAGRDAA